MKTVRADLLALGFAIAAASVAGGWFVAVSTKTSRRNSDHRKAPSHVRPYRSGDYNVPNALVVSWLPPLPQPDGKDWIYDLFTPPEIYYDVPARRFSVSPPRTSLNAASEPHRETATPLAGVLLRNVSPNLYRLQLVGFFQSGSSDLGLFQNVVTGETFIAARGRVVSALSVVIQFVDVGTQRERGPVDSLAQKTVATATIKDQITGELVCLSTEERCYAASARACLELVETPTQIREVVSGDSLEVNGQRFSVLEVRLSPPSVILSRAEAGGSPKECFTLECQDRAPSSPEGPSA